MRGTKGSAYDGGHRVPVSGIGLRENGNLRDMDSLTAHIDLLPTLADICHLDTTTTQQLDGISLLPWLQNRPPLSDHSFRSFTASSSQENGKQP